MIRPLSILLAVFLFTSGVLAQDVYFNSHPTLWKDADILIWTTDSDPALDPKEFCLSLKRNNTGIGEPKCRILGEWERDSVAIRYAAWLNANMDPELKPEMLKARHPAMQAKLQALEDKIVLYVGRNNNYVNIALFDETSLEPKAAGRTLQTSDKISLGDAIASSFFDANPKRRLSKAERAKMQTEPDDYYQEVPSFKGWIGVGAGYAQAKVPLTPDSWYRSHIKSKISQYRVTKDSVSLWNFMDDSTPIYSVYAGGTWYGFIGLELTYRFANHDMKTADEEIYDELDHWNVWLHEIGLSAIFSQSYATTSWLNITPFIFIGFQYSFLVESIDTKGKIKEPSKDYRHRIEFEDAYKGVLVGLGSHFVVKDHYGLGIRTGISSRGRDMYVDPSPDAGAQETIVGGSTIDWFISGGLEYHWSL